MKWAVIDLDDQYVIGIWNAYADAAEFVSDNQTDGDIYVIPADELTEETVHA